MKDLEEEKDESTLMVDIGNLFYLKFEVFLHTIGYYFTLVHGTLKPILHKEP